MDRLFAPLPSGCCVRPREHKGDDSPWLVIEDLGGESLVLIEHARTGKRLEVFRDGLSAAFMRGMQVQDCSPSVTRKSLGRGTVVSTRTIAGREQVLVEFHDDGDLAWLPFEVLRHVWDPASQFVWQPVESGAAERLRLRILAHALGHWQQNTGALSSFDVDPLPHQLQLVHDIISSGNLNWLIADDVGLGKTIEMGLLLHALQSQSFRPRRVLVVTPAGLMRQWRDALTKRFKMPDFRIYGQDFTIHEPSQLQLYPRVIASLDKIKRDPHLQLFRESGVWDTIVFDEGHRLTRKQSSGSRYASSQRFRLAAELRKQTSSMFLLSATPHQGDTSMFGALLELLRPEWKDLIARVSHTPEIVRDIVYRNRKSEVIDIEGQFVFQGHQATLVNFPGSDAEAALSVALVEYLRRGYAAASADGSPRTRAIGFVMTVYRKLAASSMAALHRSLARRLVRLERLASPSQPDAQSPTDLPAHGPSADVMTQEQPVDRLRVSETVEEPDDEADGAEIEVVDERFGAEAEEDYLDADATSGEFFGRELEDLRALVDLAERVVDKDSKYLAFKTSLLPSLMDGDGSEPNRVLIFTEYRTTLELLVEGLRSSYGASRVVAIHGGLDTEARLDAEDAFTRGDAWFLVSTEAGGEGLNLHHACHTVVNYDLPWNPMRLVQRIGRVYRYGQSRQVRVFNLHGGASIDSDVVADMYARLDRVVQDLCGLGDEYHPRLHEEILGELVSLMDVEDIIRGSFQTSPRQTRKKLDEAIARADQARELQQKMLSHARGFSRERYDSELHLDKRHLQAFVHGALLAHGATLEQKSHTYAQSTWRLPAELMRGLGLSRPLLRITFEPGRTRAGEHALSWEHAVVKALARLVKKPEFGGDHAVIRGIPGDVLAVARLRWQDDQGRRQHEELVTLAFDNDEEEAPRVNPPIVADWLLRPAFDGEARLDKAQRVSGVRRTEAELEHQMAVRCGRFLNPQQVTILGFAEIDESS